MWTQILSDRESGGFVYVAEELSGRIVGIVSGGPERTGDPEYAGELSGIYLRESHQRKGIGRRLVRAIVERLTEAGLGSMIVWVLRDNAAREFYEALGGQLVRQGTIEIDGMVFEKVAYGWSDTAVILGDPAAPGSPAAGGQ